MNLFIWPSLFFIVVFFNYEIHQRFQKKRDEIEHQFTLRWNSINIPAQYIEINENEFKKGLNDV